MSLHGGGSQPRVCVGGAFVASAGEQSQVLCRFHTVNFVDTPLRAPRVLAESRDVLLVSEGGRDVCGNLFKRALGANDFRRFEAHRLVRRRIYRFWSEIAKHASRRCL